MTIQSLNTTSDVRSIVGRSDPVAQAVRAAGRRPGEVLPRPNLRALVVQPGFRLGVFGVLASLGFTSELKWFLKTGFRKTGLFG